MKVSVVISCYNLGRYLEDAVSSVESQTYSDWELIIVDDGSTDAATIDILKKLKSQKPYKIISQKNSGLAEARNTGISQSSGKYIVCLDADDMLATTYLEKTVGLIEKSDDKVAVVTTWLQEFGARQNLWETKEYNIPELLMNNVIHVSSMFTKEVWDKVGGYKKMRIGGYEDWNFWLSVVDKGYRWAVVKEPLFYYRIRKGSMLDGAITDHTEIYKELFSLHKQLFRNHADGLIVRDAEEIRALHSTIAEKNKAIEEYKKYEEEVIELREKAFKLKDEIHAIRNARVLGRVVRLREFVGTARHRLHALPRRLLHAGRLIIAPFVPAPVRRRVKYRLIQMKHRQPKTVQQNVIVPNKKWPADCPLVSVVIPYYNRADTIDETVGSLKNQSYKNFEVIVVNDGSTDPASIEKLNKLAVGKLNLKIIEQPNTGVASARNKGIANSKGKYIVCLDSDDMLEHDFIEKCTVMLETNPEAAYISTNRQDFGVLKGEYTHIDFSAAELIKNNMIITAAEFRKEAWKQTGGYKSDIGYEDWEFWINLAEKGWWGKLLPESLFRYRTALSSRYSEDKDTHWRNLNSHRALHPDYDKNVRRAAQLKQSQKKVIEPAQAFINMNKPRDYVVPDNGKPNVLIALPWMTFGGAETMIVSICQETKENYNLSFVTALKSPHEWEYKFKELSTDVYHLANLFESPELYVEFVANYIKTRGIEIMHIIHTSEFFEMLPELKKRCPKLKVIVTVFNDRAEHFGRSIDQEKYIDAYSTDNNIVKDHYLRRLKTTKAVTVIPNGINCFEVYNPALYNRDENRERLGIEPTDLAVFFISRVSEEKNPDVFCRAAEQLLNIEKYQNIKFFVIGDGPLGRQIEKMIRDIGSKNIQYLGYQAVVTPYLSAADVFILPSSIEGFPPSILEAMAMKVAVIASRVGAIPEVIDNGENGFVVTPGAMDEICVAIKALNADRDELKRVKINARKKLEKTYSIKIVGEGYKKLYRVSLR